MKFFTLSPPPESILSRAREKNKEVTTTDNEIEYITSSHPEEPEPVPFREKHPNLFWLGIAAATGGGLGLMRWMADFLIGN